MKNKSNKIMISGVVIVSLIVFVSIFANFIAPFNPTEMVGNSFERPSFKHLLGTNDIGQDIFSELVYGGRFSLIVGLVATIISTFLGVIIGTIAGLYGKIMDNVLMKFTSFVFTTPYFPLIIVLSALLRGNLLTTALVLGFTSWPEVARVMRAATLKIVKSEYITTISAMGARKSYILRRHILRELSPLIAYRVVARFKFAILAESSLSFLGLSGTTSKSWGKMLYFAQAKSAFLTDARLWWVLPPGLLIAALSLGLMMIAYGFETKIDPRLEGF